MSVKQFLNSYNIGRSTIRTVTLKNVRTDVCGYLDTDDLSKSNYHDWGDRRINTFTITKDDMILYVQ